jgi:separase
MHNLSAESDGEELFNDIRRNLFDNHHTVLIVDSYAHRIPWESLPLFRNRSVSRMPSSQTLRDMFSRHSLDKTQGVILTKPEKVCYVINPDGDLKSTETDFAKVFES